MVRRQRAAAALLAAAFTACSLVLFSGAAPGDHRQWLLHGFDGTSVATLTINLTDKCEPGSADSFSVDLRSGSTILFSSNWSGTLTSEQVLGGGNLVVH
jgi:hypothetical protein